MILPLVLTFAKVGVGSGYHELTPSGRSREEAIPRPHAPAPGGAYSWGSRTNPHPPGALHTGVSQNNPVGRVGRVRQVGRPCGCDYHEPRPPGAIHIGVSQNNPVGRVGRVGQVGRPCGCDYHEPRPPGAIHIGVSQNNPVGRVRRVGQVGRPCGCGYYELAPSGGSPMLPWSGGERGWRTATKVGDLLYWKPHHKPRQRRWMGVLWLVCLGKVGDLAQGDVVQDLRPCCFYARPSPTNRGCAAYGRVNNIQGLRPWARLAIVSVGA